MLITIDDEEELDRIGGIFLERIQKMFDEDSDDDSEE
jgi:hypothetical protein